MVPYKTLYFLIFAAIGTFSPYINLYFKRLGLSGSEIGLLATMRPLATLIGPTIAVAIAARFRRPVYFLPALMFAGLLPFTLLLGVRSFIPLLITYFLVALFKAPAIPLIDDATMRRIDNTDYAYGAIRLWGSVGFILGVNAAGVVAEAYGMVSVLTAHLVTAILGAGVALILARSGDLPQTTRDDKSRSFWQTTVESVKVTWQQQNVRWLLVAGLLARSSALTQQNFFAIYADQLGLSESLIGLSWAIAVTSEIGVMALSSRFGRSGGARTLFILGIGGSALRWAICAWTESPWVLLASQTLHGLTFGALHVGAVTLIHTLMPPHHRTQGQSAWTVITSGLPGLFGTYLLGYLFDLVGLRPLFALSAGIAVIGIAAGLRVAATPHLTRPRAELPLSK